MHKNVKDLTGQQFGNLTVICLHPYKDKKGRRHWVCRCVCGNYVIVRGDNLRRKNTKRCSECSSAGHQSVFITPNDEGCFE